MTQKKTEVVNGITLMIDRKRSKGLIMRNTAMLGQSDSVPEKIIQE
jgi:hypothetical protein